MQRQHIWRWVACIAGALLALPFGLKGEWARGISMGALLTGMLLKRELGALIIEIFPAISWAAKVSVLGPWQGRYFAYDNVHIRFFVVDGRIWVAAADFLVHLDPPPSERELRLLGAEHAPIPGQKLQGLSETAMLRLVTNRTTHHQSEYAMLRFRTWLERETLPNIRRFGA